ncbi:MAG: hypothetical protein L6Q29_03240 [Candidatus Pacebacteria bacterium]|nr:hypothetical protein [Candidatus Paceibacterota bacterium]NUQ57432.1 hypothetical protein [Candidatus Paceibacter sp.]
MGRFFVGVWFDDNKTGLIRNNYFSKGIEVVTFKDFKNSNIFLGPKDILVVIEENEYPISEWLEFLSKEKSKPLTLLISCPCHIREKKEILSKYNVDFLDSELIKNSEESKKNIGKLSSLVFNRGLFGNIRFISESECRLSYDYKGDLFILISNLLFKSRS